MPNIGLAFDELLYAADALKYIVNNPHSVSGEEYMKWNQFLIHLSGSYSKACSAFNDIDNTIIGDFKKLRKLDPLLTYLRIGRNNVEHYSDRILDIKVINSAPADWVFVEIFDQYNNVIRSGHIPIFATRLLALTITTNEGRFDPPKYHQGVNLDVPDNPIEIGIKGYMSHFAFLKSIDETLNGNKFNSNFIKLLANFEFNQLLKHRIPVFYTPEFVRISEGEHIKIHPKYRNGEEGMISAAFYNKEGDLLRSGF